MVEVKTDKVEQARKIRMAYAQKRKANGLTADYERLIISNCVNLATRVRIDILKALATKISNT
jgi:hypothetical protein